MVSERVAELWGALRDVAVAHIADVDILADAYLGDRAEIDQVTADELAERLRGGRVVVLDVRPDEPRISVALYSSTQRSSKRRMRTMARSRRSARS